MNIFEERCKNMKIEHPELNKGENDVEVAEYYP